MLKIMKIKTNKIFENFKEKIVLHSMKKIKFKRKIVNNKSQILKIKKKKIMII